MPGRYAALARQLNATSVSGPQRRRRIASPVDISGGVLHSLLSHFSTSERRTEHGYQWKGFGREKKGSKQPNIPVIFGDDIGMWNVGAYTHGMMGRTPNIDSIARDGMLFTDHYGQPSCTAGRAAFLMGQLPVRTGMTTIGIHGSTRGIQKSDPTLAEVLRDQGYATGQFGKNQLVIETNSRPQCTDSMSGSAIFTT